MKTAPEEQPYDHDALVNLAQAMATRRTVVLTGAGCSTESGIPDYRGPQTPVRKRPPMQYLEFVRSESARQRYWARSFLGWPKMAAARPGPPHRALSQLESQGHVVGTITQNVDGLHHAAGSSRVVELHGSLHRVRCLDCGATEPRFSLQDRLGALNDGQQQGSVEAVADGDATAEDDFVETFRVADCVACGGVLKPHVVFFGENVPPAVTQSAWDMFEQAELLLVIGSSLHVFSGYRFAKKAAEQKRDLAIINIGSTRADAIASYRIEGRAGSVLQDLKGLLVDEVEPLLRSS